MNCEHVAHARPISTSTANWVCGAIGVWMHLLVCSACKAYVQQVRLAKVALRSVRGTASRPSPRTWTRSWLRSARVEEAPFDLTAGSFPIARGPDDRVPRPPSPRRPCPLAAPAMAVRRRCREAARSRARRPQTCRASSAVDLTGVPATQVRARFRRARCVRSRCASRAAEVRRRARAHSRQRRRGMAAAIEGAAPGCRTSDRGERAVRHDRRLPRGKADLHVPGPHCRKALQVRASVKQLLDELRAGRNEWACRSRQVAQTDRSQAARCACTCRAAPSACARRAHQDRAQRGLSPARRAGDRSITCNVRLHDRPICAGRDVLVIGGGDSALEAAAALTAGQRPRHLAHRSADFSRKGARNAERIATRSPRVGAIAPGCGPVSEITPTDVALVGTPPAPPAPPSACPRRPSSRFAAGAARVPAPLRYPHRGRALRRWAAIACFLVARSPRCTTEVEWLRAGRSGRISPARWRRARSGSPLLGSWWKRRSPTARTLVGTIAVSMKKPLVLVHARIHDHRSGCSRRVDGTPTP